MNTLLTVIFVFCNGYRIQVFTTEEGSPSQVKIRDLSLTRIVSIFLKR